jgi:hypothetical protein
MAVAFPFEEPFEEKSLGQQWGVKLKVMVT